MRRRAVFAVIGLVALASAAPASARAPLSQVSALRSGTAVVQYDKRLTTAKRLGSVAGIKTSTRYRVLPFVAGRGSAARWRSAPARRGVKAIHMDRRLSYFLHESVPIAYGGH